MRELRNYKPERIITERESRPLPPHESSCVLPGLSKQAEAHLLIALGTSFLLAGESSAATPTADRLAKAFTYDLPADVHQDLTKAVGTETMTAYETVVRTFPYDNMIQHLSQMTGLKVEQLERQVDLEVVVPYTQPLLGDIVIVAADRVDVSDMQKEYLDEFSRLMTDRRYSLGMTLLNDRVIGINIGSIKEAMESMQLATGITLSAEQQAAYLRASIKQAITHELVHAITEGPEDYYSTTSERVIHEGMIDAIAMELVNADPKFVEEMRDVPLSVGYTDGPKQAGRYLLHTLGVETASAAVVQGHDSWITTQFDSLAGQGTWQQVIAEYSEIPAEPALINIRPLYDLMRLTPETIRQQTITTLNQKYGGSPILPIYDGNQIVGVYLLEQGSDKIVNGMIAAPIGQSGEATLLMTFRHQPRIELYQNSHHFWYRNEPIGWDPNEPTPDNARLNQFLLEQAQKTVQTIQ